MTCVKIFPKKSSRTFSLSQFPEQADVLIEGFDRTNDLDRLEAVATRVRLEELELRLAMQHVIGVVDIGTAFPAIARFPLSKSAKCKELGFGRFQCQVEPCQALAQSVVDPKIILLIEGAE